MSDINLINAKKGDVSALNQLLEANKHLAYTVALRYVNNEEDAEDIVQESFIKVFLHINKFKSESKFSTWLFKIVYHESLKFLHSKKLSYGSFDETKEIQTDEEKAPNEEFVKVTGAMKCLNNNEYVIMNLFYLGEKDIKEIAEITGHSRANVKVILHRARKKLSDFFTKDNQI